MEVKNTSNGIAPNTVVPFANEYHLDIHKEIVPYRSIDLNKKHNIKVLILIGTTMWMVKPKTISPVSINFPLTSLYVSFPFWQSLWSIYILCLTTLCFSSLILSSYSTNHLKCPLPCPPLWITTYLHLLLWPRPQIPLNSSRSSPMNRTYETSTTTPSLIHSA